MPEAGQRTILLIGATGQVGWELRSALASLGSVVPADRTMLDLTDLAAIRQVVRAVAPDLIVNAAAYTQVDQAESEAALAHRINAEAVAVLADEAQQRDALMVHYSTDYVFDGRARVAYREADAANPLNVYGRTKHAGDLAVLGSGARACIFRIGWVYGNRGSNFLRTIQRLAAARTELRIVADQHGGPSWCGAIAAATASVLGTLLDGNPSIRPAPRSAVYHMAPPDVASWFDFATAILAGSAPGSSASPLEAISTRDYPTAAPRPAWSVLDSSRLDRQFDVRLEPWRMQLARCLAAAGGTGDRDGAGVSRQRDIGGGDRTE